MKRLIIVSLFLFACLFAEAQVVPQGAVHPGEKIILTKTPEGQPYACARFDVATFYKGIANSGYIEIDSMVVISENLVTGQKRIVAFEDYNQEKKSIPQDEGGLYDRNPWYVLGDPGNPLTNAVQKNGCLLIRVGEQPNHISHFWSKWFYNDTHTRLYVKVRFRITGEIGFQIGVDYAPYESSPDPHAEAFVSKWYNDTRGIFIEVTCPDYDQKISFDRNDYGFHSNGTFYISKKMVDYENGTQVELKTDLTRWEPRLMTLNGNRYEYSTGQRITGSTLYCFRINGNDNHHLPAKFMESGINPLEHPEDVEANQNKGYNFRTLPFETLSQSKIEPYNLKVFYDASSRLLNVFSGNKIQRLYISDMAGRVIDDFNNVVPEKIWIGNYISGVYLVTIETVKGTFSEKFVK